MKGALEKLRGMHAGAWHGIVWVGPGYGAMLDRIQQLDAENLVILEPHPGLHARLARRLNDSRKASLSDRALWSSVGVGAFHLLSDPLRSTLRDPGEVFAARPNLKCVTSIDVELESVESLAAEYGLSPNECNLLILDATGVEQQILANTPADVLTRFTYILCGRDQSASVSELAIAGFTGPEVLEKGLGVTWTLWRHAETGSATQALGAQALRSEIERLLAENAGLEAQIALAGSDAEIMRVREQGHAEEAARALQQATSRIAALETELSQLNQERGVVGQRLAETEQERRRLQVTLSEHVARMQQLQQEVEDRTRAYATIEEQGRHAAQMVADLQSQLKDHDDSSQRMTQAHAQQVSLLQEQLREARQTANLSAKLQTLREADLADLQTRYEQSRAIQEHQHQLLVKVSERLGMAAGYFRQLSSEGVSMQSVPAAEHVLDGEPTASDTVVPGKQRGQASVSTRPEQPEHASKTRRRRPRKA